MSNITNKQRSRTLRKPFIFAIILSLIGIVLVAFTLALLPSKKNRTIDKHSSSTQSSMVISEIVRNASESITVDTEADTMENHPQAINQQTSPMNINSGKLYDKAVDSPLFFADESQSGNLNSVLKRTIKPLEKSSQHVLANTFSQLNPLQQSNIDNDQNKQTQKNSFLQHNSRLSDSYLSAPLVQPISPYEVKAGSIIPLSLITGINSDLPGDITGQVRENVYDSVTGNHLLIPQGSRVIAKYDSMISFGQERVLVCWNRLIRPDGSSINLECSPGVDLSGHAGFSDQIGNHWGRIIGAITLSSILSVAATKSQGNASANAETIDQLFVSNIGQSINSAGQKITEKNLDIQPTIKIRPGYSVNILVNKDIILHPYSS